MAYHLFVGGFFVNFLINMAVPKIKYAQGNSASTTLSSSISNTDTAAPLTSDTNFNAKTGEGMVILGEGTNSEELAYATGKAGSSLTIPLVNRGLEGTSAAGQASGNSVKGILTAGMWNDAMDALSTVVDATTGAIKKASGAEVITGTEDAKIVTPKAIKDSGLNIDSGAITIDGTSSGGAEIRLAEDTDNGTNYVSLKAPATLSADKTFILPSADGTAGQFIKTNGSGTLSFGSATPTLLYNGNRTGGNTTVSSITSAYGDIGNEFTATMDTTGGLIQVNVMLSLAPNVASYPQTTRVNLRVDSSDYLLGYLGQTGNVNLGSGYSLFISGLSAGSHTFKVQVGHNSTGSIIVIGDASTGARMQVIEYPS